MKLTWALDLTKKRANGYMSKMSCLVADGPRPGITRMMPFGGLCCVCVCVLRGAVSRGGTEEQRISSFNLYSWLINFPQG